MTGNGDAFNSVMLTNNQQQQIQLINDRDNNFDRQLDDLSNDLQDLIDIAEMKRDEVQYQTTKLTKIDESIDQRTERLNKINIRTVKTLDEAKRKRRFGQITLTDFKLLAGRI